MIDLEYLPQRATFSRLDTTASVDEFGDPDAAYVAYASNHPVHVQGVKPQTDQRTERRLDDGFVTIWVYPTITPERFDRVVVGAKTYQIEGLVVEWTDFDAELDHYEVAAVELCA